MSVDEAKGSSPLTALPNRIAEKIAARFQELGWVNPRAELDYGSAGLYFTMRESVAAIIRAELDAASAWQPTNPFNENAWLEACPLKWFAYPSGLRGSLLYQGVKPSPDCPPSEGYTSIAYVPSLAIAESIATKHNDTLLLVVREGL